MKPTHVPLRFLSLRYMRLPLRLLLLLFHLPLLSMGQVVIGGDTSVCSNDAAFQLRATPAGGVWSGPTAPFPPPNTTPLLTPTGTFTPRSGVGTVRVTYTLGAFSASRNITMGDPIGVNAGLDTVVCSNVAAPRGTIGPPRAAGVRYKWTRGRFPANGLDFDTLSQPSITLINNGTLPYSVVYYLHATTSNFNPGSCTAVDSVKVTVYPSTTGPIVVPPLDTVCAFGNAVLLPTANPSAGLWYGSGIIQRFPGIFQPDASLAGTIQLTYRAPCNAPQKTITVNQVVTLPQANAGPPRTVCINIDSIRLVGFPTGGVWVGPGVRRDGWIVRPSASLVGTQNYTYWYPSDTGLCKASSQTQVTFKNITPVTPAANQVLCSNAKPKQLTGQAPAGGTFTCPANPGLLSGDVVQPSKRNIGTWVVRYTYVNPDGCSNFAESLVTIQPTDSVNAGHDTSVCSNARAFNLSGYYPASGVWTGGNGRISSTGRVSPVINVTGFYQAVYTVTSSNGCISKDSLQIEFKTAPAVPVAAPDTSICANAPRFAITRSTPAGGRYRNRAGLDSTWGIDSVAGTFTPSRSLIGIQTIYYIVRASTGCSSKDSLLIDVRSLPVVNAGIDFNVCSAGDSIRIGFNGQPSQSPSPIYKYRWTGSAGTDGFARTDTSNPKVLFRNTDQNPVVRTYILQATRTELPKPTCSNNDTLKVTIYPRPRARTLPLLQSKACEGDTVTLRAETNPRYKYQWLTRNSILTPVPTFADSSLRVTLSNTYYLRVLDTIVVRGAACADTSEGDSIYIKKRNRPTITGRINFCAQGGVDSLHVSPALRPALSYQWLRNNAPILSANDTVYRANVVADYRVLITDSRNGVTCYDTSAATAVDSIPRPYNRIVKLGSDSTFAVCSGDLPFTVVGPRDTAYPTAFKYRWQDGSPNQAFTIDTAGLYYLTVSNECGSVTDTLNISEVKPTPVFSLISTTVRDTTVCTGIPFVLSGPPGNFYNWHVFFDSIPSQNQFNYDSTKRELNIYTGAITDTVGSDFRGVMVRLRIINPEGCSYSDTIRYKVHYCIPNVYIPTAFTPQGDDVNDQWILQAYGFSMADTNSAIRVYVYNRWGQQVYYAGDLTQLKENPWDGTFNGEPCVAGSYQYVIEYKGVGSNRRDILTTRKTGTVTIIR